MRTLNSNRLPVGQNAHDAGAILIEKAVGFAANEQPSAQDVSAFQDAFYTLALKSSSSDRRQIANILARGSFTPRSVAYYFCLDALEIAAPVLRYSPVLKNRDFVSLILRSDLGHVRVIAQRDDLDLTSINAIIAVDADDHELANVLRSSDNLMSNPAIRFALDRAIGIEQPKSNTRQKPVDMGMISSDDVTDLSGALLNLAAVGGKTGRNQRGLQNEAYNFKSVLEERLLRHARDMNFEAFAYVVERECQLSAKFVMSTLEKKNAGDLATILAGLETSPLIASRLMLILIPDLGRNTSVFRLVVQGYEKLVSDDCRNYLTGKGARFDTPLSVFPNSRPASRGTNQYPKPGKTNTQEVRAA